MNGFICNNRDTVVETETGKLMGFSLHGIYTFYGIPYADAERFQLPKIVKPWKGIREALNFGYAAPLLSVPAPTSEIMVPHRFWPENEHCQYLNIWSPDISTQAKKPVIVWLHGGDFVGGSGMEQAAYDGHNVSRFSDAVFVTLNHRLNLLGYADLSELGSAFRDSANTGMADIVAALRWIRDNIGAFGGDAGNITLMGQSGGGAKILTLGQIPEADGLYHRWIIMSGIPAVKEKQPGDDDPWLNALLLELGLAKTSADKLLSMPLTDLYAANRSLAKKGVAPVWRPTVNAYYLGDPLRVGFRKAQDVPLLIGTTFGELNVKGNTPPFKNEISSEAMLNVVTKRYGSAGEKLVKLFKEAYPQKKIIDLLSLDTRFRRQTIDYIDARNADLQAPVYNYLFALEQNLWGGSEPWHCSDIPFALHNTDKTPYAVSDGKSNTVEAYWSKLLTTYIHGEEPISGIHSAWLPYTDAEKNTLLIDFKNSLQKNHDRILLETMRDIQAGEKLHEVINGWAY